MHSNNRKRCHPLNTALRLITFLARNLIAIAVVIILIVLATFISYDMANIYVMINDGLSERANVIIHHEDPSDLSRFFTMSYLFSDPAFQSDQYKDYIVSDYDYDLKIKHMWVWPWESSTVVTVEEVIDDESWKFNITDEFRERLMLAQMPQAEELPEGEEEDSENEEGASEEEDEPAFELEIPSPKWQNGEKLIEFVKVEGQWKINGIEFVRSLESE